MKYPELFGSRNSLKRFIGDIDSNSSINSFFALFLDCNTNPRRKRVIEINRSYGKGRAIFVKSIIKTLFQFKSFKKIMKKSLKNLSYDDVLVIRNEALYKFKDQVHLKNAFFNVFKSVLAEGVALNLINVNCKASLSLLGNEEFIRDFEFYTDEELNILFRPESYSNQLFADFAIFAALTGMRKGEIIALRWRNVDIRKDFIKINVVEAIKSGTKTIGKPKNEKFRSIICPEPLNEIILRLYESKDSSDFVFKTKPFKSLTESFFMKLCKEIKKLTNKENLKFKPLHGFRHTLNTYLLERDVNSVKIATLLGWSLNSTLTRTQVNYTHLSKDNYKIAEEITKFYYDILAKFN